MQKQSDKIKPCNTKVYTRRTTMDIKKQVVNVRLRPSTRKQLEDMAHKNERTLSEFLREILERYCHTHCE